MNTQQKVAFITGGDGDTAANLDALVAGGADVLAWDDNPDSVAKAAADGIGTAASGP